MDEKKKKNMIDDEALDQVVGGTYKTYEDLSEHEKSLIHKRKCPYCFENLIDHGSTYICQDCRITFGC